MPIEVIYENTGGALLNIKCFVCGFTILHNCPPFRDHKVDGIIVMSEHGWDTEKHLCPMCRGESKDVDIEREILDDYQNLKLKSVLDKYREALLKIRKIRRNKLMPNHEQDEIYNIAVDALNAEDYVCHYRKNDSEPAE